MGAAATAADSGYTVTTVGGTVWGPGPMPATPLTGGVFTHVTLNRGLAGETVFFNNGVAEPNVPTEKDIFGEYRGGTLSNGVPFNEHVHGGIVNIGQGALRMMAVIAGNGPMRGGETYRVDERLNWRLSTDMALDPGFPEGLVVSEAIDISSGIIRPLVSMQTEQGLAGGFDLSADVPSGGPVVGSLGDSDDDGFLDGRIVGAGRVPLKFLFVPGAPLVMSRTVITDIPVSPRVSAILELAGVANLYLLLYPSDGAPQAGSALDGYYARRLPEWAEDFTARARRAAARLTRIGAPEAALASELAAALAQALPLAADRAAYRARLQQPLQRLETALPQLKAAFEAATIDDA